MSLKNILIGSALFAVVITAFAFFSPMSQAGEGSQEPYKIPKVTTPSGQVEEAIFAGGCFWCMEPPFEKVEGVELVVSGYVGGKEKNPTYKQVSYGRTGHTEAVKIIYDPAQVSFDDLLRVLWRTMDPTDVGGQFVDRGTQYRPGIYYLNEAQKKAAMKSRDDLAATGPFKKPIALEIVEATEFWPAEGYHQDFYKTTPGRYYSYRKGSGRDNFIEKHWGEVDYKALAKSGKKAAPAPSPEKPAPAKVSE